jgi:hypothetical protein
MPFLILPSLLKDESSVVWLVTDLKLEPAAACCFGMIYPAVNFRFFFLFSVKISDGDSSKSCNAIVVRI